MRTEACVAGAAGPADPCFAFPDGTRGKNIDYKLTPSTLKVGLKGQDAVLDGNLTGKRSFVAFAVRPLIR